MKIFTSENILVKQIYFGAFRKDGGLLAFEFSDYVDPFWGEPEIIAFVSFTWTTFFLAKNWSNLASPDEFITVDGIGKTLAKRVFEKFPEPLSSVVKIRYILWWIVSVILLFFVFSQELEKSMTDVLAVAMIFAMLNLVWDVGNWVINLLLLFISGGAAA